jgi:proteic killer suppression protein
MIASFRDEWLCAFFVEDVSSRNVPSDLENRLFRKLQMIDDATTDLDLRVPPSNHFEKLRGNLENWHSISREQTVAIDLPLGCRTRHRGRRLLG